ncbi:hypothetical protein BDK51DRAFT_44574 [Blyttiomyces helicus]|uniref:Ankyrin repeat-containing domain protein n=1 Tax=Blyttiomyces helicus TaxID=388810 RepID=A0A4P9VZ23_9FUNG|nr:hypothetical protein BDK51DRAFT_44574 [Blyttiomyces helicus]|eukprot:RKO85051.1 hypothetical protein BDK51DRAFT_44574 [Blyttiomyces helicus]
MTSTKPPGATTSTSSASPVRNYPTHPRTFCILAARCRSTTCPAPSRTRSSTESSSCSPSASPSPCAAGPCYAGTSAMANWSAESSVNLSASTWKLSPSLRTSAPRGKGRVGWLERDEDYFLRYCGWPPVLGAIAHNRWDAVRLLIEAGFRTNHAGDEAAHRGARLDDVDYLLALGRDHVVTAKAINRAARRNHAPLVRLLHARGFAVTDEELIRKACDMGWPDMVACLLETGAPIPPPRFNLDFRRREAIGDIAATRGYLSVVEILHEKSPATCSLPSRWTELHIALWRWSDISTSTTPRAAPHMRLIRPRGPGGLTLSAIFTSTALRVAPPMRWTSLSSVGPTNQPRRGVAAEVDAQTYKHIVFFLHNHRTEGCNADAIDSACKAGSLDFVRNPLAICPAIECGHALVRAANFGHVGILRVLFEAGNRLPDAEVESIRRDTGRKYDQNVYAFLDEMHGATAAGPICDCRGKGPILTKSIDCPPVPCYFEGGAFAPTSTASLASSVVAPKRVLQDAALLHYERVAAGREREVKATMKKRMTTNPTSKLRNAAERFAIKLSRQHLLRKGVAPGEERPFSAKTFLN